VNDSVVSIRKTSLPDKHPTQKLAAKEIMKAQAPLRKVRRKSAFQRRRGAMLVLVALMMFGFLVTAAFSVDIAYMHLVKSELRSATDAAAKAAAEELARTQNKSLATAKGIAIGQKNSVAGAPLVLSADDFQFGKSVKQANNRFEFTANDLRFNAVQVRGIQTSQSASGSIGLFFGRLMGTTSFTPTETATVTYAERDIILVVDRSGSMLEDKKFVALQNAMSVFLAILDKSPTDEQVGLASYSTSATADIQMTTNLQEIRNAMSSMPVDGFTNISGGIDAGMSIVKKGRPAEFIERSMVLLTDGLQNRGRPAINAAIDAVDQGVIIHTISFGADADRAVMQQIADIGHGKTFHAANGTQLEEVFREIATSFTTVMTQ
jgi:Flp pilus assembly protein TadG